MPASSIYSSVFLSLSLSLSFSLLHLFRCLSLSPSSIDSSVLFELSSFFQLFFLSLTCPKERLTVEEHAKAKALEQLRKLEEEKRRVEEEKKRIEDEKKKLEEVLSHSASSLSRAISLFRMFRSLSHTHSSSLSLSLAEFALFFGPAPSPLSHLRLSQRFRELYDDNDRLASELHQLKMQVAGSKEKERGSKEKVNGERYREERAKQRCAFVCVCILHYRQIGGDARDG